MSQPANFSSLALPQGMIDNLDQMGYLNMTPIQAEALPFVIEGRDVCCTVHPLGRTAARKTAISVTPPHCYHHPLLQ